VDAAGRVASVSITALFRVDASLPIGSGHVMRCLTLAEALRDRGVECLFASRLQGGHLCDLVRNRGFAALEMPGPAEGRLVSTLTGNHAHWLGVTVQQDAEETLALLRGRQIDWLVVDHYSLDATWERALRPACKRIMVIDDLADRPHDCDLLLDQNLGRAVSDYDGLVPCSCDTLIGPKYALLRPEFARLRSASLARKRLGHCRHILVTMGGVDMDNVTCDVLAGLETSGFDGDVRVTVVMGAAAPWIDQVKRKAERMRLRTSVLVNASNMAELMCEADLAIGAAGSTSWERCCMGMPTIQVVLAENQTGIASALEAFGAAISLSREKVRFEVNSAVVNLLRDSNMVAKISSLAARIVDGKGVGRVATLLAKAAA